MQQEQLSHLDTESFVIAEQPKAVGPVLLDPEWLTLVSGGVGEESLPRHSW